MGASSSPVPLPGPMPWLVGEKLRAFGVEILNAGITGQCHQDGTLLTGDSPLASNSLGKLAADVLLREVDVPSAAAILDRFLHHSEVLQMSGKSYRLSERENGSKDTKAPTGSPADVKSRT